MRWCVLTMLAVLLVGGLALAEDGSIPYPAPEFEILSLAEGYSGDGSVLYPVDAEVSFLCPIWAIALCCLLSAGVLPMVGSLVCTIGALTFGILPVATVVSGYEIIYPGIRCRPGDPVPQRNP